MDPPDNTLASYFEEFNNKRCPNFTTVEDLVLYKACAAFLEDPTVRTDQTIEMS